MKVNLKQSFKDFKGLEIKSGGNPVFISDEVGKILFNVGMSANVPLSVDEKYMAYKLCNKIASDNVVELTMEESAFILRICGEHLTAGAYGQIRDLFENN